MIKIIKKDLYKYLFYLFLFSVPLQTRKVFLTDNSFYTGDFTEYGTILLYLSDILLILTVLSLCLFNPHLVKKGLSEIKIKSSKNWTRKIFSAMLVLAAIFFLSTITNQGHFAIGLFRSLKITEMLVLVFFIFTTLRDKAFLSTSLFIIVIAGILQSILAIYQFLYQKNLFSSPFMHQLTGETILSTSLPGIAKIGEGSEKMIRAYGTFPHPNLLGGFLIFALIISLYLYAEHKAAFLSSISLLSKPPKSNHLFSICWVLIFLVQAIALVVSFSRSAWIGFSINLFVLAILMFRYTKIVSRETIGHKLFIEYREITISLLIFLLLLISNFNLLSNRAFQDISITANTDSQDTNLPQNDTFSDRNFFDNVSRETIANNPLLGSGPGTAIFQIKPYLAKHNQNYRIEPWQLQPAHNIYILSASEIGILGFLVFIYIIITSIKYSVAKIVSRETLSGNVDIKPYLLAIIAGYLFIGLFDHYLWTMQQAQIMFWITIGLLMI